MQQPCVCKLDWHGCFKDLSECSLLRLFIDFLRKFNLKLSLHPVHILLYMKKTQGSWLLANHLKTWSDFSQCAVFCFPLNQCIVSPQSFVLLFQLWIRLCDKAAATDRFQLIITATLHKRSLLLSAWIKDWRRKAKCEECSCLRTNLRPRLFTCLIPVFWMQVTKQGEFFKRGRGRRR